MALQSPRTFALFAPELKALLARGAHKELRQTLALLSPLDLAEGWEILSPADRLVVFKLLSRRRAVVLFESLDVVCQAELLDALERDRAGAPEPAAANGAAPAPADQVAGGDATQTAFPFVPPDPGAPPAEGAAPAPEGPVPVGTLLRSLAPRTLRKLNRYLQLEGAAQPVVAPSQGWPDGTVGRLMHPPSVPLDPALSARQALEKFQISLRPGAAMPVSMLFVTGREGRLHGTVELRDLLAAPPDAKIGELCSSVELIKLAPATDQEEAAKLFERYDLSAAPVVDDADRLVGILTVDDILHVIQKEASEDIAKLAGTSAEEFGSRTVFDVVKLRMPWLLITVIGGLTVSFVIRHYETTLTKLIALATFTPLIAGMGGNVGTQSSTIVVRGLATGAVRDDGMLAVIWREARTGMTLGVIYGVLAAGAALGLYWASLPHSFALVVGLAMFVSMTTAATLGAAIPFILQRLGADPANATGPFISTLTDLLTTTLYLGVATALLITA